MAAGHFRAKRFPDGTFLLFVALGINITTTLFGLFSLSNVGRQAVYYLFQAISAAIFLMWLIGKYTFLCCTWNIRPCCADNCTEIGCLSGKSRKMLLLRMPGKLLQQKYAVRCYSLRYGTVLSGRGQLGANGVH